MTDLRINGSRVVQEEQLYNADARVFFDRANRKTEITFNTTRLFTAQGDAESFMLLHEAQFAVAQGTVSFVGATVTTTLANAVVETVSSAMIGCTTRHSYRIVGGIMSGVSVDSTTATVDQTTVTADSL